MGRQASNIVAIIVGIASVYCAGVFVVSWFPGAWTLADLFDWIR